MKGVTTKFHWFKVWGLGFGVERPVRVLYGDGMTEERWTLCGKAYLGPLLVTFFIPMMRVTAATDAAHGEREGRG
jgi:hypothetical protein